MTKTEAPERVWLTKDGRLILASAIRNVSEDERRERLTEYVLAPAPRAVKGELRETLRDALIYARTIVVKWCYYQGSNKQFICDTTKPIDDALAALSRVASAPIRGESEGVNQREVKAELVTVHAELCALVQKRAPSMMTYESALERASLVILKAMQAIDRLLASRAQEPERLPQEGAKEAEISEDEYDPSMSIPRGCTCRWVGEGNDPDAHRQLDQWCPVHGRDPDAAMEAARDEPFVDLGGEDD